MALIEFLCTQLRRAGYKVKVTSVGFCVVQMLLKEAAPKNEAGGDEKRFFFFTWPKHRCFLATDLKQ